ncbi:hypothetical protein [Prosthecomicrobium sp. N25]|uniref:hypothetical protein n=1 Tax=Prosthecomicrobium sp. N25 TaxID=3129254 RepID=UPI003077C287
MYAFIAGVVCAVALAVGAGFVVDGTWQRRVDQQFSSKESARVSDEGPDTNLVGRDWKSRGDPR